MGPSLGDRLFPGRRPMLYIGASMLSMQLVMQSDIPFILTMLLYIIDGVKIKRPEIKAQQLIYGIIYGNCACIGMMSISIESKPLLHLIKPRPVK